MDAAQIASLSVPTTKPSTLACAFHDCSCSIEGIDFGQKVTYPTIDQLSASTTSEITIQGTHISLLAPNLAIRLALLPISSEAATITAIASDYWSGTVGYQYKQWTFDYDRRPASSADISFNGSVYNESFIKTTGICIASEAYSWGFSSLLLLTFCVYTVLFATTLIMLQTDVYHHSQSDRNYQSHSIYADILIIAETLKSTPEYGLLDPLQSPKVLEEELGGRKHGIRFDMRGLPPPRADEAEARREKMRDNIMKEGFLRAANLSSSAPGDMELQLIEPLQQEPVIEGDGLISRVSHEEAREDKTVSGTV
jgi:hypothetical protein